MRALRVVAVGAVSIGLLLPASAAHAETKAESIDRIVREAKRENHLRAVIVRVTKGDKVVTSQAYGTSLDGVRATTRMRFRNGAVAFAYVSTLLLKYVDQGKVSLDDTIDEWLPGLPNADRVTLKMLANQTSGYPDYERDTDWVLAFEKDLASTSGRTRNA